MKYENTGDQYEEEFTTMKCPKCGFENQMGKFCQECGTRFNSEVAVEDISENKKESIEEKSHETGEKKSNILSKTYRHLFKQNKRG